MIKREAADAIIFDMDGTLLDSMEIYDNYAADLLLAWGYTPKPGLNTAAIGLGAVDLAPYLKEQYQMKESIDEINAWVDGLLTDFYANVAPLKPGAAEIVREIKEAGIPMALATATAIQHVENAMKRTGLFDFFDVIVTSDNCGIGKSDPAFFDHTLKLLGARRERTWVFEDSLYAVKVEKQAGLHVCGMYDRSNAMHEAEVRATADYFAYTLEEARQILPLWER